MGVATARADVGASLGARGGLQLRGDTDPFVGADLRLDESARDGGHFKDYGFWRVSVGFTIGFPR
jgi:hypothetical protein